MKLKLGNNGTVFVGVNLLTSFYKFNYDVCDVLVLDKMCFAAF